MSVQIIFTSIQELPLLDEIVEIIDYEINHNKTHSIVIKIKAGVFRIRTPYSLLQYCGDACSGPDIEHFVKCRRKKEDGTYIYSLFLYEKNDYYAHTNNFPYKRLRKKQQKKLNLTTMKTATKEQLKLGRDGLHPLTREELENEKKYLEELCLDMAEDLDDPLISMTYMASWNNNR